MQCELLLGCWLILLQCTGLSTLHRILQCVAVVCTSLFWTFCTVYYTVWDLLHFMLQCAELFCTVCYSVWGLSGLCAAMCQTGRCWICWWCLSSITFLYHRLLSCWDFASLPSSDAFNSLCFLLSCAMLCATCYFHTIPAGAYLGEVPMFLFLYELSPSVYPKLREVWIKREKIITSTGSVVVLLTIVLYPSTITLM